MASKNSASFARRMNVPLTHSPSGTSVSPRPSLSRPHWPWAPDSHTRAHSMSSSSSLHSVSASPGPPNNWEAGSSSSINNAYSNTARQSGGSAQGSITQVLVEPTIRQWNFSALEWTVRDVQALRDFVEQSPSFQSEEGLEEPYEVLRESPVLGDGKFKLEIVRTLNKPHRSISPTLTVSQLTPSAEVPPQDEASIKPTLSLYITSMNDHHHQVEEYDVTMLAAVKVQDDRGGERGARADWVWECWEKDWSFRQDSEVWECTFPSLSSLLENPRIAETDSFVICIQIHNPVGPLYPQHPSAYYVPRDLLDGVEASLDNPHTGDVRFICLERLPQSSSNPSSPMLASTHSRRSASESSAYSFTPDPKGRKRVIYAHSDILSRRSEYFKTMLSSSFSESSIVASGERKVYEVIVEEADFVTIYWLLKYCYANWVLFKEEDDPRAAVEWIGEGWSAKWLSKRGGEWDWKPFGKPGLHDDSSISVTSKDEEGYDPSVRSATSPVSTSGGRTPSSVAEGKQLVRSPSVATKAAPTSPRATSRMASAPSTPAPGPSRSSSSKPSGSSSRIGTGASTATKTPSRTPTVHSYPLSPRLPRQSHALSAPQLDPHPHPTPAPQPASALSIWLVAHRYSMPGLSTLALSHMMNTIQPGTALPLLLATARWDDLHALVEDYIVDQWDLACASEEFDRCCQEVAAGEWGPEGGRTFAALFRRLRSR